MAHLADLLGMGDRQLQRWRDRGLPMPAARESLARWAERANLWLDENRRPQSQQGDPKDPATLAHWILNHRKARAMLAALELQERRALLHGREECDRASLAAVAALRQAVDVGLRTLAKTCASQAMPEALFLQHGRAAMREAFAALQAALLNHATAERDTSSPPAAARPEGTTRDESPGPASPPAR